MKVAFAGTPGFARVALECLHGAGFIVPLVLTQPDRPAGRGMNLSSSAVKEFASACRMLLAQPRGLRLDGRFAGDAAATRALLEAMRPDVLVVAAYGLILPRWLLDLPRLGALNIHASLLPRWRGAAPVQRAIEAGDLRTGVTIMQMNEGLDTGDLLLAESVDIDPADTAATLTARLAALGARLIVDALERAAKSSLERNPQPAQGATYARKVAKSESAIDWSAPGAAIERRVRAFDPFPGCSFMLDGESIKLWRAALAPAGAGRARPGQVLHSGPTGIAVACGDGALALQTLQRPGGRRVEAAEFLARRPIAAGTLLNA